MTNAPMSLLSLPLTFCPLPDRVARKLRAATAAGWLPAYGVLYVEQCHEP